MLCRVHPLLVFPAPSSLLSLRRSNAAEIQIEENTERCPGKAFEWGKGIEDEIEKVTHCLSLPRHARLLEGCI
jgi:hypothetical protein